MPQKIRISLYFLIYFFIIIVIGLAANKSDLYEKEQVSEKDGREYAKKIGAIFKQTSACTGIGINELFNSLGSKFLNPNYVDLEDEDDYNENPELRKIQTLKLDPDKTKEDKSRCNKWCDYLDFFHLFHKKS